MKQLAGSLPLVTAVAGALSAGMIALTPAVSNDLAADIQHSMTDLQQRAVELTDYVANPIQTWIDTFETAGLNLQSIATQFQAYPFVASQQIAANFLHYGSSYVGYYQAAANGAVGYYLGTIPYNVKTNVGSFIPRLQGAVTEAQVGNISGAVSTLYQALWNEFVLQVAHPLESIPQIINPITANLSNASSYLTVTAMSNVLGSLLTNVPNQMELALGAALQNVYNSFAAGDPVGGLINAIDVPGEVINAGLNGSLNAKGVYISGLISESTPSFLSYLALTTPQGLASKIVAPNAQNIMSGGSLSYALGYLGNVVTTGFPTPQIVFDNLLNVIRTYAGIPSAAAAAAANGSGFAALAPAASALPGLSAGVLKAFDPAAVTN
ncbi:hypothetical protein, partial [Mycobacterium heidelbergense]